MWALLSVLKTDNFHCKLTIRNENKNGNSPFRIYVHLKLSTGPDKETICTKYLKNAKGEESFSSLRNNEEALPEILVTA